MVRCSYDVIVIGDFRFPGGTSTALAEELVAQAAAGYRTALIQIKGPVLKQPHPFHPRIRACIDGGLVELVDPDTPVEAKLLLAHHPTLFTHRPTRGLNVSADVRLLVIWHPPFDGAGAPAYDWASTDRFAQAGLGGEVVWAPVGPSVRAQFEAIEDPPPLLATDWHSVVDPAAWHTSRERFCDPRPVIGRHSRPDPLKWPDDPAQTLAAYPADPRFLVRVLGAGPYLRELLGAYPPNWQIWPFNALPAERFLSMIDFFVYFHHSRWVEAFGRTIVEAMASGAVAILQPSFRALFGDAALYAEPADVPALVSAYRADARAFRRQSERGRAAVRERFSHASHVRRLRELIGEPRRVIPVATTPGPRLARRVLFVTSNGVGMGHLTRMLAIARRCPKPIEPVVLTMSQAVKVVREQGFLAEHLPFHRYLGCDVNRWNGFLREELHEVIGFYDPRVVVFDGHVPYLGLVRAIGDNPDAWSVWCRRPMWRPGRGADTIKRERHFDAVLEPRDLAESYDVGLTREYRERTRTVDPIRLLNADEILPREEARRVLGLEPDRPAALVLLGSGNNYDYQTSRQAALARLSQPHAAQIAIAEWLIAESAPEPPEGTISLKEYPLSRYFQAFDLAISAAGYNSFHELLFAGLPTIFVPNENPEQDDQLGRARFAERRGMGMCVRANEVYRLGACIDALFDPARREAMRARCAELALQNGAEEAARFIEEMVYSRRADRPFA